MQESQFDWREYARIVLSNIEKLQTDIEKLDEKFDRMQTLVVSVQVLKSELSSAQNELKRMRDNAEALKNDFTTCQMLSLEKGGVNNTALALLKKDVKRQATSRSVLISFLFTVIGGVIVLLISHFIGGSK